MLARPASPSRREKGASTLSVPSLQGAPAEQHNSAHRGARLSTAAAAGSGHVALAALAAAQAAGTQDQPEPVAEDGVPAELDQFFDELAGLLTSPITSYQREKLQASLVGAIDARFATLLSRLPA